MGKLSSPVTGMINGVTPVGGMGRVATFVAEGVAVGDLGVLDGCGAGVVPETGSVLRDVVDGFTVLVGVLVDVSVGVAVAVAVDVAVAVAVGVSVAVAVAVWVAVAVAVDVSVAVLVAVGVEVDVGATQCCPSHTLPFPQT